MPRTIAGRITTVLALSIAIFTLLRVVFPDAFAFWANSAPGQYADAFGTWLVRWLLQEGSPLVPIMDIFQRGVNYVDKEFTTGNLLSAILGALGVGGFNLFYNWLRNLSIRRMCSAMLYFAAWRIVLNTRFLYQGVATEQNPKPGTRAREALHNTSLVRSALHRTKSELETLQDFAIAYDYAIWRGLRFWTARLRMRSMAVREAFEVIIGELAMKKDGDLLLEYNNGVIVGVHAGLANSEKEISYLDPIDAAMPVVTTALDLAERLEVGFLRSFFLNVWPATASTISAPALRAKVRTTLIKWHRDQQQDKNQELWDRQWVASVGQSIRRPDIRLLLEQIAKEERAIEQAR